MNFPLVDLVGGCEAPDILKRGAYDLAAERRVEARVLSAVRAEAKPRRRLRGLRLALLIAAVVALLTVTVYAVGSYYISYREQHTPMEVTMEQFTPDGTGDTQHFTVSDPGFTFTLRGTEKPKEVLFRPEWLPSGPTLSRGSAEEGYSYLIDDGDYDRSLPYLIRCYYATQELNLAVWGDAHLVSEERDGDVRILTITAAATETMDEQHYVIGVHDKEGYLFTVGGTADAATIRRIYDSTVLIPTDNDADTWDDTNFAVIAVGHG